MRDAPQGLVRLAGLLPPGEQAEGAAADAALEQARQQVTRSYRPPRPPGRSRARPARESSLDLRPCRSVDDSKGLDGLGDVLGRWARHPPPAAPSGDAQPFVRVPGDLARVARVRQHRSDGGVSPSPDALVSLTAVVWRRNAGVIQLVGDHAGRFPGDERREDSANGLGLRFIDDRDPSRVLGIGRARLLDGRVAEGPTAGVEAGDRAAFEAAVGLTPDCLEVLIGEQAFDPEQEPRRVLVRRAAGLDIDHANVRGGQVLEHDSPGVAEIARQAR